MDISLVVPSFKQASTIRRDLRILDNVLQSLHITYEIILVIDGDIDGTSDIVRSTEDLRHVHIETLPHNHGKGYALKHGFSLATGDIVGFIDAGGDIDYECIRIMVDLMNFSHADIVIGSKRHELSIIEYPLMRRIYSMGYQMINQALFHLHVRDTQVGVKLFRHEVISTILPHIQINRFAFDLELLVLARIFKYGHIVESPVRIRHAFSSTINIFSALQTLADTLYLYFRERKIIRVPTSAGVAFSLLTTLPVTRKQKVRETVQ